MISLRKFNSATKFLFLLAPILLVSGCATVSHSPGTTSKAAALAQAEPGPDRLLRYCRRMAATNNIRIAVGVCKRALETAPENPAPVLALAGAYIAVQKDKEAAEAFRFALTIDPNNAEAHYGLGKLYLRNSELAKASVHLEAALSSEPNDPAIFNALGILKDQLGAHATAQSLYRAGLDIDPENTALSNNLGVSLLLSERLSEGMSVLGSIGSRLQPNETRRQNLAAAQEAIAATHLPLAQDDSGSSSQETAETSPLQNVRTVSAPKTAQAKGSAAAERAITPARQPKRTVSTVKAKPALPPKLAVTAPTITPARTVAAHDATNTTRSSAVVLDALENDEDLDLHPVITPAPVQVVDFQTLPPLPQNTRKIAEARPLLPADLVIVAEELPDLTATTAVAAKTSQIDLAVIIPHRKPLQLAAAWINAPEQRTSLPVTQAAAESQEESVIADIPHLPLEANDEENGTADGGNSQMKPDEKAGSRSPVSQIAELKPATAIVSPWNKDEALPGDELMVEVNSDAAVQLAMVPSGMQRPLTKVAKPDVSGRSSFVIEAVDGSAPAEVLELARHHQGGDAGLAEDSSGDATKDSGDPAEEHWQFDLAALPASGGHRNLPLERKAAADLQKTRDEPGLPSGNWLPLTAIRETPPAPDPEPHGDRLLALMMIHRESYSTA